MSVEQFAATSSKGPFSMRDRYVTEDIPMGASLTVSLARKAGVPTPTYDAMIHLASTVNETDFYRAGRTLENLGLGGLRIPEIDAYLRTGKKPAPRRTAARKPAPRKATARKPARRTAASRKKRS
jgi:opine dehydrogenase